ncbi:ABC efflux pump, inner membrane subunit [Candidatus Koribacter versatilis Ellin345]|uniref:ABC efflux pump, inner membrane subunit n=1 Tax=Koribacter versatilis (strain Ellin345) TaxID=204669 RepID=Q1IJR3_KORVE|nr:ABC transporter permease [Candidatus Koribacter versatilis]ABF42887.1 ABC efflux pump, inner membrane subunit [Candidatus Koribacter versatilis Ellin345]
MRSLLQDVRYGFRGLRKSPGYALLAIAALALGIGANTALFSAIYGILLKPLPYANGKRLVLLQQSARSATSPKLAVSVQELEDYRKQAHSFDGLVEYHSMQFILLGREPDRVETGVVSANFFDVLGVKPLLGRTFRAGEDLVGAEPVLVLSYKYWQEHHGGDPNIVGKSFRMNDKLHTVIGVLPPIPQYPRENDVYMPVSACPTRMSAHMLENRAMRMLNVFGILKPGVTLEQANAETSTIAARFTQQYPNAYRLDHFAVHIDSLQTMLTTRARPLLIMLLITSALVLVISCANVANLALARMTQREYEMAIRSSLGAPRTRLIRQVLTECTLLAIAGGLVGLLFAQVGTHLLSIFLARFTTRAAEVQISGAVLAFTMVVSIATGLLFGLAPALNSTRRLAGQMQTGARSSSAGHMGWSLRSALIVAQVCISYVLLVIAGLTLRSFDKLQKVDAGFNAENVVAFTLPVNFTKYAEPVKFAELEQRVKQRIEQLPGVTSAASISGLPLGSTSPTPQPMMIEKQVKDPNAPNVEVDASAVSPNAFFTLGVPFMAGRDFNALDTTKSENVTIFSASTAKRYFGNEDPVGRRVSYDNGENWWRIVGVVGDVRYFGLDRPPIDEVYVPAAQIGGAGRFVVRTTMDEDAARSLFTKAVRELDNEQPVTDFKTLREVRDDSLTNTRVTSMLLTLFAGLALVLAATGLFGVISFLVSQRTREIGIRLAMGAQTSSVLVMMLRQGVNLVAIGLGLGVIAALAASNVVKSLLFGVSTRDWITFVGVGAVLFGSTLLASYLPARRAAKVQPMEALRCE